MGRKTVLFVHGTGAREKAYETSFQRIEEELGKIAPTADLAPCFWGSSLGAQDASASIPGYERRRPRLFQEFENHAWSLLIENPVAELEHRLRNIEDSERSQTHGAILADHLSKLFALLLEDTSDLTVKLQAQEIHDEIKQAVLFLVDDGDFLRALRKKNTVLRDELARAIVAIALQMKAEAQLVGLIRPEDDPERDQLVKWIAEELGDAPMGLLSDWASNLVTSAMVRHRSRISDLSSPLVGDILRYQARGREIREFIGSKIRESANPVIVLAHSLGGIAAVETLIEDSKITNVEALITYGSQSPYFYELDALATIKKGEELPSHFPSTWLNFFDQRDQLSFEANPVFSDDRIEDIEVKSGQPAVMAHSAYLLQGAFWKYVGNLIQRSNARY